MKDRITRAALILRWALAITFLSAVGSRLGLWGGGWLAFVQYTAAVNSFLPASLAPVLAIVATALEIALALFLLTGYALPLAAAGAGVLTLIFALAMAWSFGLREPMDYSVFVDSAAAFLLAEISKNKSS